jgi:hypothetical protein
VFSCKPKVDVFQNLVGGSFQMSSNTTEKAFHSKEIVTDTVLWLRLFPRWALVTGITTSIIPILFLGGMGQIISDNALGQDYVELLLAARSPYIFRATWAVDAIVWLMLGGILISATGLLRRHAPIRSVIIFVCGIAQLFGALGSFLRLDGIGDIAAQYLTALPEQQIELLDSYLNLLRVINSSNHIGVLLQGIGYLLVSWGVLSLRGFPRWLAVWFSLPGFLAVAQFSLFLTGASYMFLLNVIGLVAGNIALNFATAITLWRPSDTLISSVEGGMIEDRAKL